jgi:hypothetical protein
MRKTLGLVLTIVALLLIWVVANTSHQSLRAQGSGAMVVAICGTVPPPYQNIGAIRPLTMDVNGKLCQ